MVRKEYNMKYADILGAEIMNIRKMTEEEAEAEGWDLCHDGCKVIELDNGMNLYPSKDYEGNGAGAFFIFNGHTDKYHVL